MANCDNLFKHFNGLIKLSDEKREILVQVRNSLRTRMEANFSQIARDEVKNSDLKFQSQGSFVMDTIIAPRNDDFDLDDGVYFIGPLSRNDRPSETSFHKWVIKSIGTNDNYEQVQNKDTCVRVKYKKEKFHIDLPIYYADNFDSADLAHEKDGWSVSNPLEFIEWFEKKAGSKFNKSFLVENSLLSEFEKWTSDIRKEDAQLRRMVRYLKVWADNLGGDMPPGIVMTILAAENYIKDDRDDISLNATLKKIQEYLMSNGCKCPRPTTPKNEDLFKDYSPTKKEYFLDRLKTFVNSSDLAISNPNPKEACLKWKKHLGDKFPCSLAADIEPEVKSYSSPAILGDSTRSANDY